MYFKSRRNGKRGLPWFDSRTNWEKSSDEYFEKLDDLARQLDDVDAELCLYTSLTPDDFDSGYEYVYGRIKELKEYIAQDESSDPSTPATSYGTRETLQDIYEDLLDLYDDALLYDDYCGADTDDLDDDDDWDNDDTSSFGPDDL